MTKYYLIQAEYVGPNDTDSKGNIRGDTRVMSITTVIGTTNMSHEERTSGWLGTNNDTSLTACGEFETLESARATAHEMGFTESNTDSFNFNNDGDESWITPEADMDKWDAGSWFDGLGRLGTIDEYGITEKTTDDELNNFVEIAEAEAREENILIFNCLKHFKELRDELIQ